MIGVILSFDLFLAGHHDQKVPSSNPKRSRHLVSIQSFKNNKNLVTFGSIWKHLEALVELVEFGRISLKFVKIT